VKTTINIDKKTRELLKKNKKYDRETYDDTIRRLIGKLKELKPIDNFSDFGKGMADNLLKEKIKGKGKHG
jgi:hypothetical protein